jgi:hypothetical protein
VRALAQKGSWTTGQYVIVPDDPTGWAGWKRDTSP